MAFVGRTTATRGALIRLRDTLEFIRNGRDILKMKRDRLAGDLNSLLGQMNRREELERHLANAYADLKAVLATEGYETVSSTALSVPKIKIDVLSISIMGVVVPKITIKEKPKIDSVRDLSIYGVAEKMEKLIPELFEVAQIEANIERIAYELMMINRKVNALDKVVIPAYERHIRYIEDLLFDEDLEDFSRIKHIKIAAGKVKA